MMLKAVLTVHIVAGALGLLTGSVALYAAKAPGSCWPCS
jgi:hypothetical protein